MKKTTIAIILATIAINFIQAQTRDLTFVAKKTEKDSSEFQAASSSPKVNKANTKAVKDFSKLHQQAENVQWYAVTNGSFVYYSLNEKIGRRLYNEKGNFVYDILTYSEKDLSLDIRAMVKQTYYLDYDITLVKEIHTEGKTIYIIDIQSKSTLKILRIRNDEMEVLEEYKIQQ